MTKNELQIELEKAKAEENDAYVKWMYYEAADLGYDYAGARQARDIYYNCCTKTRKLEERIKGMNDLIREV